MADLFSGAVRAVSEAISPRPLAPPPPNPLDGTELSGAEQSRLLSRANGAAEKPELARLAKDAIAGTAGLPSRERTALLRPIADPVPGERARFVGQLLESKAWSAGSAEQRRQLASVAAAATAPGAQQALLQLAANPATLSSADSSGTSLLSHLDALAAGPLHDKLEEGRAGLLAGVLGDLANPGQVKQEDFTTCTVTSIQYELAQEQPAEYARLMAGLAGTSGKAELVSGGALSLQQDYLPQLNGQPGPIPDARTASQILFQTAAMEYGNGKDDYSAVCKIDEAPTPDCSVIPDSKEMYPGLDAEGVRRVLTGVFGEQFALLHERGLDPQAQQRFLSGLDEKKNRPVLLSLKVNGDDYARHEVTFERISDGRVYFRNPYGDKYTEQSEELLGARLEDPRSGIYSIPLSDFASRVDEIDAPVSAIEKFLR